MIYGETSCISYSVIKYIGKNSNVDEHHLEYSESYFNKLHYGLSKIKAGTIKFHLNKFHQAKN